jgi:eukaryotic-like serine/threonine-protein kinase
LLNPGTKLGLYEIVSAIGAGGMGEVYQAHDTKLGRDVALKVLPETFAADPNRMARFERESRLLASLNPTLQQSMMWRNRTPIVRSCLMVE